MTTSIRLRPGIKQRLDRVARQQKRRRNQIVVTAIERYLAEQPDADLEEEARRQSLRASGHERDFELIPDWDNGR